MHTLPPKPPDPVERWESDGGAPAPEPAFDWRARLEFDDDLIGSPFVRLTWVSAAHVVRLVCDAGWSWGRIAASRLAIEPDDIRACLMWAEEGRPTS
jgi:uncharacterized protein (DUF433 family)